MGTPGAYLSVKRRRMPPHHAVALGDAAAAALGVCVWLVLGLYALGEAGAAAGTWRWLAVNEELGDAAGFCIWLAPLLP